MLKSSNPVTGFRSIKTFADKAIMLKDSVNDEVPKPNVGSM